MEDENAIYKQNDNLATEDLGDDGIIILNLSDEYTHVLNDTGKYLWLHIDGIASVKQIIDDMMVQLTDTDGFTEKEIAEMCQLFFDDLKAKNLIVDR